MAKSQVITEGMIEEALALLDKRIAQPPPPSIKSYSRRDAFLKLKARTKEALAAGHSLETILDDLKGIGIGMTISTARQYLKPGRKTKQSHPVTPAVKGHKPPQQDLQTFGEKPRTKGTFTVTEDDKEI
jgi:hypothetical protein